MELVSLFFPLLSGGSWGGSFAQDCPNSEGGAGQEGPESALAWLGSGSGGGTEEERQGLEDPGWDLFGLGAECGMVT